MITSILDIIDKISASTKQVLITIIGILATLYYIHVELKDNFDTLYRDLDQRLTRMSNNFEKFAHGSEIKQNFTNEKLDIFNERIAKLETEKVSKRELKSLEEKLTLIQEGNNTLSEKIFFLDRFIARIETHMLYSKNNYKLENTGHSETMKVVK